MASAEPRFSAPLFSRQLTKIHKDWISNPSKWHNATALVISLGKDFDEFEASRTRSIQSFLFQYELSDTLMVLTWDTLWICTGPKKFSLIEDMMNHEGFSIPVEIKLRRLTPKQEDLSVTYYDEMIKSLVSSSASRASIQLEKDVEESEVANPNLIFFGIIPSDVAYEIKSWRTWVDRLMSKILTIGQETYQFSSVDVHDCWGDLMLIKEDSDIRCTRTASSINSALLKKVVLNMETVIDEGTSIMESQFVDLYIAKYFDNPSLISKQLSASSQVEYAFAPTIQSGTDCTLGGVNQKDKLLEFNTIVIELGVRFKSYCSGLARTYMVDANKVVRKTYNFTLELQNTLLSMLVPGTTMSSVYAKGLSIVRASQPHLEKYLVNHFGGSIGIEASDEKASFSSDSTKTLLPNMIVQLRVGFSNATIPSGIAKPPFSVLLSDTVLITADGYEVLTRANNKYSEISYSLQDTKDEDEHPVNQANSPSDSNASDSKLHDIQSKSKRESMTTGKKKKSSYDRDGKQDVSTKNNGEDHDHRVTTRRSTRTIAIENPEEEALRQAHQKQLAIKQRQELLKRFSSRNNIANETKPQQVKDYVSYESDQYLALTLPRNRIHIDMERETVLLPLFGHSVPFHIRTIKTTVKTEDYLKITFRYPGVPQVGENFKSPNNTFVKELLFQVFDPALLNEHTRLLNELKKRVQERESEKKAIESLILQEPLLKSTRSSPKLNNLFIRPTLVGSNKTTGFLEVHQNGFRYMTFKRAIVDIIYKNVKYAFFQPAENDAIILLHFHLYHAIMIGKKKTHDVQFYLQVIDTYQDSGALTSWNDPDEIEREQRERDRINMENRKFLNFVEDVESFCDQVLEFERPYRDLGFYGVTGRENVFLMPTMNCLVSLVQSPFFVLSLEEVEVVFFERIHFSIRNFDITFVLKDYTKLPIQVSTIARENLEMIKKWLDSCNSKYYSSIANLNWKSIMERIRKDCLGFWEEGGWDTYEQEDESDEEDVEEEDVFEPSSTDEEDYECFLSEDDEPGDDADDGDDDDESEDWDQQEEKLKTEDARRDMKENQVNKKQPQQVYVQRKRPRYEDEYEDDDEIDEEEDELEDDELEDLKNYSKKRK